MKKFDRMESYVANLGPLADAPAHDIHPCYAGYFTCFNRAEYYEAHDVLEHIWLRDPGSDEAYFRGLIQIAGAFVHLKKQFESPLHHVDGRRLGPASRLFRLGMKNISPYAPTHMHLDIEAVQNMCQRYLNDLEAAKFEVNPWHPDRTPRLSLIPIQPMRL